MRITAKQLRQLINEEINRMMSEAGPETTITTGPEGPAVVGQPALSDLLFTPGNHDFVVQLQKSIQASSEKPVVTNPDFSGKTDQESYQRLFNDLLGGKVYSDKNADPTTKMTINDMISTFARSLGEGRYPNFVKAVDAQMPTSDFGDLLRRVQKLLGITADGIMGIQTYFAILSGGAIDIDPGTFAAYRKASSDLSKVLGSRKEKAQMLIARLKTAKLDSAPSATAFSTPTFGPLAADTTDTFTPSPGSSKATFAGGTVKESKKR